MTGPGRFLIGGWDGGGNTQAALEDLLTDDAARQAAGRFGASIADLGAGEVATAKIVDLLG